MQTPHTKAQAANLQPSCCEASATHYTDKLFIILM
uniref:Uncharacterized protein n=1 Tax=Anguilla anguilla TaxID=7936 RepID=A0A0E9UAF5_ANGAN